MQFHIMLITSDFPADFGLQHIQQNVKFWLLCAVSIICDKHT